MYRIKERYLVQVGDHHAANGDCGIKFIIMIRKRSGSKSGHRDGDGQGDDSDTGHTRPTQSTQPTQSTNKRSRRMDDNDVEHDLVEQRYRLINNLLSGLNKERNDRDRNRDRDRGRESEMERERDREGPRLVDVV